MMLVVTCLLINVHVTPETACNPIYAVGFDDLHASTGVQHMQHPSRAL